MGNVSEDYLDGEAECPDCQQTLIFMEEKKKFWCPSCSSPKVPLMAYGLEEEDVPTGKERIMHGYFEEEKLKDANPLAFYGIILLIVASTLVLFWFSYTHNPLGVPESY